MAIDSVTEMWSRQTGQSQSNDGLTFVASFASAYQVVHSPGESRISILDSLPVKIGDVFQGTSNVYCKQIGDIQPVGPIMSIVPVSYSGEVGPGGQDDNPLNKAPDIEYYNATTNEPIDQDGYGVPITNCNGEPVDGVTKDIQDMVLTVNRNFASVNSTVALQYLDSVNSDVYTVLSDNWQPGQAAMTEFKIKPVFDNAAGYFNVSAKIVFRLPYNTVPDRAWWARYRNEGYYVRFGTKVTFTGGGGSGAVGYAVVSSGAVSKIVITSRGRGYSTVPSVAITSDTGGTGATAMAVLNGDQVTSVTITAGGSGYKSGMTRAVDKNKEPVSQPVLLKADGTQEEDAESAVWIERPKKSFRLPYNALGLLS